VSGGKPGVGSEQKVKESGPAGVSSPHWTFSHGHLAVHGLSRNQALDASLGRFVVCAELENTRFLEDSTANLPHSFDEQACPSRWHFDSLQAWPR
jgi:hypothetical protein